MTTLTLGFSPCPNDTFIFDALVNQKIDTGDLKFEVVLEDVETLNEWANEGRLDISKLSFPSLFENVKNYSLLNSGSALGKGVGPLVVSKLPTEPILSPSNYDSNQKVALPGIHTTANLLFDFAFPKMTNKAFMIFSAIEDAVLEGRADWGVIIHENRFTYQQKGLHKIIDLGEYWEQKMNSPIPLGGIAIKKSLPRALSTQVDNLIKESLSYAFTHYPLVTDYVRQHSQNMEEEVMRRHIDLYVNNFSLDLGTEGKRAILTLYHSFCESRQLNESGRSSTDLFLS